MPSKYVPRRILVKEYMDSVLRFPFKKLDLKKFVSKIKLDYGVSGKMVEDMLKDYENLGIIIIDKKGGMIKKP